MVDGIALGKLAIIERCLARIREEYTGHATELATNLTRQDAIVLNLQRACEAAIDRAKQTVRMRKLGLPQDARDAFTLLEGTGLIDTEIAARMRAMVGSRNVAVHRYRDLSLPTLRAIRDTRLGDFTAFAKGAVAG